MLTAPKWTFSMSSIGWLGSVTSCKKSFQKYSTAITAVSIGLEIKEGTPWSDNYGHHSLQNHCSSSDPEQITGSLPKKYSSKHHWVISNAITHGVYIFRECLVSLSLTWEPFQPESGGSGGSGGSIKVKTSIFQLNWLRTESGAGWTWVKIVNFPSNTRV